MFGKLFQHTTTSAVTVDSLAFRSPAAFSGFSPVLLPVLESECESDCECRYGFSCPVHYWDPRYDSPEESSPSPSSYSIVYETEDECERK